VQSQPKSQYSPEELGISPEEVLVVHTMSTFRVNSGRKTEEPAPKGGFIAAGWAEGQG